MKKIAFIIVGAVAVVVVAIFIFTQTGSEAAEEKYQGIIRDIVQAPRQLDSRNEVQQLEDKLRAAGIDEDEIRRQRLAKEQEILDRERNIMALKLQDELLEKEQEKIQQVEEDQISVQIRDKYLTILKRNPTVSELENHKRDIDRGMYTLAFLDTLLNGSSEINTQNNIRNIYRTYLKREPTEEELKRHLSSISLGFTFQNIIDQIVRYTPEYANQQQIQQAHSFSDFDISHTGPIENSRCVQIFDKNEPHLWTNTFLCATNQNHNPQLRFFSDIDPALVEAFEQRNIPIKINIGDQTQSIYNTDKWYTEDPGRRGVLDGPDRITRIDNEFKDVSWKSNYLVYPKYDKYFYRYARNNSELNSICLGNNTARCLKFGPAPSLDPNGHWRNKYLCYELKPGSSYPDAYKNRPPQDVCKTLYS
jgi:hypothetical protein